MRTIVLTAVIGIALCARAASQSPAPAGPIGAYTVVPELPGMGRPVDIAATAARRRALMRRIGRGTVLIPAGHERDVETDYLQDNDFRQDNTFYYFTELETQDAMLMMTARGPDSIETVLFLPPRTPAQERWTGLRLGPDSTAIRLSGIAIVLPVDSFEARSRSAPEPVSTPSLRPIVDSMRVVKDADEISRLRRAVDISVAGHIAAMRAARPGMYEYQIEAV
ncbi:MAG TPA: Xaa-Pro aminopeptidase, partial [Gemmatimonadaceae bacterium]|nr:Xaa-Pro aminopeptidase [Gemmatimonadaceae bacterium]